MRQRHLTSVHIRVTSYSWMFIAASGVN